MYPLPFLFCLGNILGNVASQILQCFHHDTLHLLQLATSCNLPGARNHQRLCRLVFAPRNVNDSEVPPSAASQTGTPLLEGLVARAIVSVPRVEGARHKEFFGRPTNHGISKNGSCVLAPSSSTPFHKISKNGLAGCEGFLNGGVVFSVPSIWGQVNIDNSAQFFELGSRRVPGFGSRIHGLLWSLFRLFIFFSSSLPRYP